MKKPKIDCPACKEVYHKVTSDEYVVICAVVLEQFERGESNYEGYTIVPSHCENYTKCPVWREEKDVNWARNMQNFSDLAQGEQIRL